MPTLLTRLLRRLRREDGAAATYLAGALVVVLVIAFAVMVPLGDAIADRRRANTAADAAVLAAADSCVDHMTTALDAALLETTAVGFWSHFEEPLTVLCADAHAEASAYAAANGSSLTTYSSSVLRLTFSAEVREASGVAGTSAQESSQAKAEIVTTSGLCTRAGFPGVTVAGVCLTAVEGLAAAAETEDPLPPPVDPVVVRTRLTSP